MFKKIVSRAIAFALLATIQLAAITQKEESFLEEIAYEAAIKAATRCNIDYTNSIDDSDVIDGLNSVATLYSELTALATKAAQACSLTSTIYNDAADSNNKVSSKEALNLATNTMALLKDLEALEGTITPSLTQLGFICNSHDSASFGLIFKAARDACYQPTLEIVKKELLMRVRRFLESEDSRASSLAQEISWKAAKKAVNEKFHYDRFVSETSIKADDVVRSIALKQPLQSLQDFLKQLSDTIIEASQAAIDAADTYTSYTDIKDESKAAIPLFVRAAANARAKSRAAARVYADAKRNLSKLATACTKVGEIYTKAADNLKTAQMTALTAIK